MEEEEGRREEGGRRERSTHHMRDAMATTMAMERRPSEPRSAWRQLISSRPAAKVARARQPAWNQRWAAMLRQLTWWMSRELNDTMRRSTSAGDANSQSLAGRVSNAGQRKRGGESGTGRVVPGPATGPRPVPRHPEVPHGRQRGSTHQVQCAATSSAASKVM